MTDEEEINNMDKVQKIREEVEKLHKEYRRKEGAFYYRKALRAVLYLIDSLQEEPVSDELEEASKEWLRPQLDKSYANYGEVKMMELTHFDSYAMLDAIEFGAKWQMEQDLIPSTELSNFIDQLSKQFPEVSFAKLSRIAVRVSKWQKQQDQSTIELAEDHAMLAGMEKMKEELMARKLISKKYEKLLGFIDLLSHGALTQDQHDLLDKILEYTGEPEEVFRRIQKIYSVEELLNSTSLSSAPEQEQ